LNLRIPGPIPVPNNILEAMSNPMINHRGPEFAKLLNEVTKGLKQVFQTNNDLYILTASGTGVMEAAIVNTLSPGDNVLSASVGVFGDRFGEIASIYGAKVEKLTFDAGTGVDPQTLRESLKKNPDIKAVLVVHNETSTGVTNPLSEIAQIVKNEFNKLLLVDGISSVGSIPVKTDHIGCDVVATASQKGWMLPPGLAFMSFSPEAWEAHKNSKMPKFYFDIANYEKYLKIGQPPFTPALSIMYSLDIALKQILNEGIENVFQRHFDIAETTRNGIKSIGLELFADHNVASNTVTSVKIPEEIDGKKLITRMREKHNIILAGGQQELSGKIFRIGHLGLCSEEEINDVIESLNNTLPDCKLTP
tara:strand:- start:4618 stop:5706 length:1089 start_codon:yes stop_codon:yes gene_type:complete